jgi:hypothetical protein
VLAAIASHQPAQGVIPITDDDMAKVQAALACCKLGGTTGTPEEKAAALLPIDDMSRAAVSLVVSAACQYWTKKSFKELVSPHPEAHHDIVLSLLLTDMYVDYRQPNR